eukprot:gene10265-10424_t
MAWGDKPSKADQEAAEGGKGRFAAPPACPRCDLTKSQMNRTIQNYQKAYRKKVEGLKQELSTVRADNQHLRSQVRRLRKKRLVHAPSLAVGGAACFLIVKMVQRIKSKQQQQPGDAQLQQGDGSVADQQQLANGVTQG